MRLWILSLLFVLPLSLSAQERGGLFDLHDGDINYGGSVQVYGTGFIVGPVVDWANQFNHFQVRLAYNLTDRSDNGEHQDEEGGGPGIGGAWHRWHHLGKLSAFYGGRVDLWQLAIDWKENGRSGETDILVLQPTIEGGLCYDIAEHWRLMGSLAVGAEINVNTNGENVGEGEIGLAGLSLIYLF